MVTPAADPLNRPPAEINFKIETASRLEKILGTTPPPRRQEPEMLTRFRLIWQRHIREMMQTSPHITDRIIERQEEQRRIDLLVARQLAAHHSATAQELAEVLHQASLLQHSRQSAQDIALQVIRELEEQRKTQEATTKARRKPQARSGFRNAG